MKLAVALGRVGASIVKEQVTPTKATLFLRVAEERGSVWIEAMTALLVGAVKKKDDWTLDVSKYFFVDNGSVRYFWRIVINKNAQDGLDFFGRACLEASLANAKELSSFPLSVGPST